MRPIKLIMKAFGPYAGVQVIDFNELRGHNMFLIHGRTGAGKTTILDGICYALYGETSGNERDGRSMRSQFADGDVLTEVELEFELRGQRYRIRRTPQQERAKKSGSGTTMQNPEAYLFKITEDKESVLEATTSKVDKKIREIIGFESKQFRQVIMIPQGQFRKLLSSGSEERQEILEKIFHTEIYKNIEQFLKEKSRTLRNEILEKRKEQQWILNGIRANDSAGAIKSIASEDPDIDLVVYEIKKIIEEDKEELEGLNSSIATNERELKDIIKRLNDGKEINAKIEEFNVSGKIYREQIKYADEYEALKLTLDKSRKALTLVEIEKTARNRSMERDAALKELDIKRKNAEALHQELNLAKLKLDNETSKEALKDEADRKVIEFEKYTEMVEEMEKSGRDIELMEASLRKLNDELKACENKGLRQQEQLEDKLKKLDNVRTIKTKFIETSQKFKEKSEILKKKQTFNELLSSCNSASQELQKLKEKSTKSEDKYNLSRKEYEDYQNMWNKGQAGILAESLEEGKPCPVCGSLQHPCIAKNHEGVLKEKELKIKKDIMLQLERENKECNEEYNSALIKESTLKASVDSFRMDLGDSIFIEDISIINDVNSLKTDIEGMNLIIGEAENLEDDIENIKNEQKNISLKTQELENEYAKINETCQSKKGAVEHIVNSIPEGIRSVQALKMALNSAKETSLRLKDEMNSIKNAYDSLNIEYSKAKSAMEEASITIKGIEYRYAEEKKNFKMSMEAAGFKVYSEYEQHKKNEKEIAALDKKIKDFLTALHSAKDRYERAMDAAYGLVITDVDSIQKEMDLKQRERDKIFGKESQLKRRIEDNSKCILEIGNIEKSIQKNEEEYSIIGDLSEAANGKNVYGITFQRFVLSALLDDILEKSNYRLKRMSSGRYELFRTMERERKNAQSGLDLEVFDNDTGASRNVATLSGGEGFVASLSLALGLADVVQAYSGGISLDTMFIDEGFGTLDPESLDYAIRTLIDLQQGGRLVGIISHVPELKERIDARLEVISTINGSRARFEVI